MRIFGSVERQRQPPLATPRRLRGTAGLPAAGGGRRAAGAGARQASTRRLRPRSPVRAAAPSPRQGEQRDQESGSPGTPRQKRDLMYGLFLITLVERSGESRTAALRGRTGSSGRGGDPSRRRKRNRGAWTDLD